MKKLWMIALACLSMVQLKAQDDKPTKGDTTSFVLGNKKVTVVVDETAADSSDTEDIKLDLEEDKHIAHWAALDVGVNGFMNKDGNFEMKGAYAPYELDHAKSQVWKLNFMEKKVNFIGEYVGLVTGLGVSFHGYAFKNNTILQSTNDSTFSIMDTVINYDKNKLKATYLELPLLLEINTSANPKKTFHIAAGMIGGYRIGARYKQKYELDGDKYRNKVAGHYNLMPFHLTATTRVGYGNFTVFADYSLTPLFERGKGPELYPFSLGVTFVGL
ncbi:MAG: PorT family protein [Flavobacteriales bacterium]|nr:PorT family protein [Flavobacteriales bacterium]